MRPSPEPIKTWKNENLSGVKLGIGCCLLFCSFVKHSCQINCPIFPISSPYSFLSFPLFPFYYSCLPLPTCTQLLFSFTLSRSSSPPSLFLFALFVLSFIYLYFVTLPVPFFLPSFSSPFLAAMPFVLPSSFLFSLSSPTPFLPFFPFQHTCTVPHCSFYLDIPTLRN